MKLFSHALRFLTPWRHALAYGVACAALLAASAGAAWADPPARAGRIADVSGTAWLFDPDTKSWVRVVRNQTIGQGDQMRTDARSRVTVRVGSSTVWLDEESDVEVLQMDDAATVLRVMTGDLALRVRTAQTAQETRIQTREGVISPEMEGLFRIDQLDRGSRLAVLQGRAQFDSDPGAPVQRAWLREGEQAEFWWAESPRIERQPISRDKFSAWFQSQDQAEAGLAWGDDAPYVSPEMTGAEDLNRNGSWEVAAEYGNVWIPTRVAVGWEPYRDGRWAWTRQWGWSWVDNAPWGFAPFHYGRWIQHRGRWAWAPGRFEPRPAYSPALVAWVGGPQVSVGITIGGTRKPPQTGWAPLAPRQSYVPAYPHSPQYTERFRWDRVAADATHNNRGDQNDRNKIPTPRGDAGPQPYRPVPSTGPAPANPQRPWGRDEGGNGVRDEGPRDGQRDFQRDPQRYPQPAAALPAQPPLPPQYNIRGNHDRGDIRDNRDYRDNRENDRDQRNREPGQPVQPVQRPAPVMTQNNVFVPAQVQPQPPVQPQIQPVQNRPSVPMFNREPVWTAPVQNQRPTASPQPAAQPAPQVQQTPPQGPPQAKPSDDEKAEKRRNKRENAERDFR